jgi:WD40 repeat protein
MSDQDGLTRLVQDARRFIMYHKGAIEGYPLQTYASALLFSPPDSLIRRLFQHEELGGISIRLTVSDGWSACLQTLEGHSDSVTSVAFSHGSTQLASASWDRTVKIWDASSGACLHTLDVGKVLYELSFDPAGCYLHTEIGSIDIRSSEVSSKGTTAEPVRPLHVGTGVSSDSKWIQYDGDNMLWVPSEYRPSCSTLSGNMVGVGVGSGQVWICSIDLRRTLNVCRNIS